MDPTVIDTAQGLLSQGETFLRSLILPSRLWQIGILACLMAAAFGINLVLAPRLYEWMRTREAWPKWRLRLLLTVHQRFRILIFVALAWLAVAVMRDYTPLTSRRFILEGVATLATAWVVVSFASRLVRNQTLRRLVRWGAWIYVTLYFLGLTEDATTFLENVAVDLGGFRLSAFAILKALVVTALLFIGARFISTGVSTRIRTNEDISPSMQVLVGQDAAGPAVMARPSSSD